MAPSIAGFLLLLVADGFKREEEEITCGELQNAVFLIRGHGTMYSYIFIVAIPTVMFTPRAHVFPWQRIDKHDKHAYGIQCSWKQGEISTSTFHSSMVSICAVLCWLVSPGTDPHALDRNKSRSEVPILKSCQAAGRPSVNTRFCQKSVT